MPYGELEELDRWALGRLGRLIARLRRAYEGYQFHQVYHALSNFCAVDLSALYLDILKDRLYTFAPNDPRRRAAQTACYEILVAVTRLMAPILTFTAEEVWGYIHGSGKPESVHLMTFPEDRGEWMDEGLEEEWERLLEVRREVARALEAGRQRKIVGSSLEARVFILRAPEEQWMPLLSAKGTAFLKMLFIVSDVRLEEAPPAGPTTRYESQDIPELVIEVVKADPARGWRKCERCWVWSERVGEDDGHPTLCERCAPVVRAR